MIEQSRWERCEPDDPRRCQASAMAGKQCGYKAEPGGKFCPRHNGVQRMQQTAEQIRMYKLQHFTERYSQLSTHEQLKDLRGEIGIMRLTLEEIINQTEGKPNQLLAYSGKIMGMTQGIKDLVQTFQKMEEKLATMVSKDNLIIFAQQLVEVIGEHVPDDKIEHVTAKIDKLLSEFK